MDDGTLYDTPNGKKTLTQMQDGLKGAGWGGDYTDPAAVIAAYNATAAGTGGGSGSGSGSGGNNSAQNLLDAIASGDQQRFDEAVRQYNQTSYTDTATKLLSTASQLRGPQDYFQFDKYVSGGRDLFQKLFGTQPRPDFSQPTGPITPVTLASLMGQLGMLPATATTATTGAPTATTPTTPTVATQNVNGGPHPAVAPPTPPTTPLSGVAPTPAAALIAPQPVAQPSQPTAWGQQTQPALNPTPGQTASQPAMPGVGAPASTAQTASQATQPGLAAGWKNPQPNQVPLPYQINPAVWDSLGGVGQALALSAAEAAGWDKNEYLRQINAARPQGTAPAASSTTFASPRGAFS